MNLSKYPFNGTQSERFAFIRAIAQAHAEGKQIERRRIGVKNGKWAALPMSAARLDVNEWYYRVKPFVPAPFNYDVFPTANPEKDTAVKIKWGATSDKRRVPSIPSDWKLVQSGEIKAGDIYMTAGQVPEWTYGLIGDDIDSMNSHNRIWRRPAQLHNPDEVKLVTPTVYRLLTVDEIALPQNESTEWYEACRGWRKPAYLEKEHSPSNTYRTHLSVAEYAKASAEAIKPKATTTYWNFDTAPRYWNFDTAPKVWLLLRHKSRPKLNHIICARGAMGVLTGGGAELTYRELGDQYEYTTDGKTWKNCLTVL